MLLKAVVFIGFLYVSLAGYARDFMVVDQNGEPVADAVILADGPKPVAGTQPAIMDQVDKAFVPHVLTVPVGQPVEFPNSDDIRHHVYSFSEPKAFEIKLYKDKPGDPIIFDQPGIVVLGCNIHDSMVGYIVVSDTQYWAQTDSQGRAQLAINDASKIRIWHPRLSVNADQVEVVPLTSAQQEQRISLTLTPPQPKESGFSSKRFKRYAR